MGQRANLAIVDDGTYELFYSHWCANTLDYDVFWGPEYLERFIRIQVPQDHTHGWLDEIWAEGSVVLDLERKVLLFFGGEDILFGLPLRRVYLTLLRRVWQGWDVRWAHDHITEIAEYLAVPREKVWSGKSNDGVDACRAPEEPAWTNTIVAISERNNVLFYPLPGFVDRYVDTGPRLIELLAACKSHESLGLPFTHDFPSGLHLDIDTRTVAYWSNAPVANPLGRATLRWPGWMVLWHRDDFEGFAPLSRGLLVYPTASRRDLEDWIARNLLRGNPRPVDVLRIADHLRSEGSKTIEINPAALRDDRLAAPDNKCAILAAVLGREPPKG
jgi:hypothetical protein